MAIQTLDRPEPILRAMPPPANAAPSTPTPSAGPKPARGTLLVVDDETGPRESLRIVFKDQYNVVTASCGRDGAKYAASNPVDVAILDIRMPDMSGTEVLRELKLIDPRIEVIMLTGYETIDSARAAVRYGAADYLNKPFDVFKMRETVARCFERRRLTIEAESSLQELQNINKDLEAEVLEKERKLSAGELSAGVVHEMNNPLAIISARAELLTRELQKSERLETVTIEKLRTQLDFIQKEVLRCRKISQRFLNFFRASSDAQETVDLAAVVEDAIALIRAHPICKTAELKWEPAAGRIPVQAHSSDLIQIFINLGINALQAMNGGGELHFAIHTLPAGSQWLETKTPDGHGECHFRSSQFHADEPIAVLTVRDTGPGIPDGVIKKIFEPYFTTKDKGHGTGLGLAICTRFLEKYQGGVRFVSRVGQGTTVTVALPTAASQ
jgi:signal transduction histidine kinase